MPVKDYNADPDLNTQISGINIAEGCAPSGINNAIRQLMADVKEEFEGEEGAVSSLDSTLRALIAQEVAKAMAAAYAAQSSADEAQSSADAKLPLAGGTMTGALVIEDGNGHAHLQLKYMGHESGGAPSTPQYTTVSWQDKNGTEIGRILGFMNSTGQGGISIRHANADGTCGPSLSVGTNADGTGFFTYDSNRLVAVESSSFTADKGYIKFTNGLLIHWVQGKATNNQVVTANFSPAFSSVTSYVVVATGRYGGSGANYNPNVVRRSASQADFNTMIGTVANNAAGFIAIGY